jgi:hypothetical protein
MSDGDYAPTRAPQRIPSHRAMGVFSKSTMPWPGALHHLRLPIDLISWPGRPDAPHLPTPHGASHDGSYRASVVGVLYVKNHRVTRVRDRSRSAGHSVRRPGEIPRKSLVTVASSLPRRGHIRLQHLIEWRLCSEVDVTAGRLNGAMAGEIRAPHDVPTPSCL